MNPRRFEVSGSLSFLQPGAGNLEYGTLANTAAPGNAALGQPVAQSELHSFLHHRRPLRGDRRQRYSSELDTFAGKHAGDFFVGSPTQMVGPPFLIGPESGLYKIGSGTVKHSYGAVDLDAGHTFCVECSFQFRTFGGVEVARIGQNLNGLFQSRDGFGLLGEHGELLVHGRRTFRLGIQGQYSLGDFQLIGEVAAAALIGSAQSQIDFTTISPAFGINNQSLTSPNATRVVPSIDARLATAYAFAPNAYGMFKVEAGYWKQTVLFRRAQSI